MLYRIPYSPDFKSNKFIVAVISRDIMIQCPRGTRDFLPDEMERRRHYENILRMTARTFGFREISTPIFEETELFVTRSGPNILNEIYAFKDKGDRDIALRPELTAPVMRMFVNGMSNEPRPLKLFYFGQCFRYERPQSGRYREFFQFGAELIGNANAETDAEAIALAAAMIKALGLRDYKIRIGHIGVLRNMLSSASIYFFINGRKLDVTCRTYFLSTFFDNAIKFSALM